MEMHVAFIAMALKLYKCHPYSPDLNKSSEKLRSLTRVGRPVDSQSNFTAIVSKENVKHIPLATDHKTVPLITH